MMTRWEERDDDVADDDSGGKFNLSILTQARLPRHAVSRPLIECEDESGEFAGEFKSLEEGMKRGARMAFKPHSRSVTRHSSRAWKRATLPLTLSVSLCHKIGTHV